MSFAMFVRRSLDKEPVVVLSVGMSLVGMGFAAFGPPLRDALGYDASNYYQRKSAVYKPVHADALLLRSAPRSSKTCSEASRTQQQRDIFARSASSAGRDRLR